MIGYHAPNWRSDDAYALTVLAQLLFLGLLLPALLILYIRRTVKDPEVYRTITPNGVDPDGKIDLETMRQDQDVYRRLGWMESQTKVEDVVDMSFVEAALKEIGTYKKQ